MKKNQLLNIKKMIFKLGRGGSKNHFFDQVNDAQKMIFAAPTPQLKNHFFDI